jgi:hypothetical protein
MYVSAALMRGARAARALGGATLGGAIARRVRAARAASWTSEQSPPPEAAARSSPPPPPLPPAALASPGVAWERARLSWLARGGAFAPVADDAAGAASLAAAAAALDAARAARRRAADAAKPLRIREHNVLAALRDPLRLVEFNRPMPLPAMIDLNNRLWAEEAARAAR